MLRGADALDSVLEWAEIYRQVDGVLVEHVERDDIERALLGARQHDGLSRDRERGRWIPASV